MVPFDSDTRPAAHPRTDGRFLSRTNWEWRGLPSFNGLLANEAIKQRIFQAKDLSLQKSGLKRCVLFGKRWRAEVFAGSRFTSPLPLPPTFYTIHPKHPLPPFLSLLNLKVATQWLPCHLIYLNLFLVFSCTFLTLAWFFFFFDGVPSVVWCWGESIF